MWEIQKIFEPISVILFLLITSHNISAQTQKKSLQNLEEAFQTKTEPAFLEQFPENFEMFNSYFGWNKTHEVPQPLYENSRSYIKYFFALIAKKEYSDQESKIIEISENGHWEADAINYFQDGAIKFIKNNNKHYLINNLDDAIARSVLLFLFDGSYPKKDIDFISKLTTEKQIIVTSLFETEFNENKGKSSVTSTTSSEKKIAEFENNPTYFIIDIDVNNDGIIDKVVSSEKYKGNQLLFFLNTENGYQLALESINFSEDGGNIIDTITTNNNTTLSIKTFFPDGGFSTATHYIDYKNKDWILSKTLYKTKESSQSETVIYSCEVLQNLLLKNLFNSQYAKKIKHMPSEKKNNVNCLKDVVKE